MKIRMTAEQSNTEVFLGSVLDKYHFGQKDMPLLETVYQELLRCVTPYAIYKINQWLTGIRYIDDGQVALVAMTLGKGPDILEDSYEESGKLTEAYMVECLANEILLNMYTEFNSIYARFHRRYVARYVFIGEDIPLSQMKDILEKLQKSESDVAPEVSANEYGVIKPSKSVVFYAMLSDNPSQACKGICYGCNNLNCENRVVEHKEESPSEENNIKRYNNNLNYGYRRIFGDKVMQGGSCEYDKG